MASCAASTSSSGSSTTNSSPPSRATVAGGGNEASSRRATASSTRSAASWPCRSLTRLNSSRSSSTTLPPSARRSRSWSRVPLTRPVSGSKPAPSSSRVRSCCSSVRSSRLTTAPTVPSAASIAAPSACTQTTLPSAAANQPSKGGGPVLQRAQPRLGLGPRPRREPGGEGTPDAQAVAGRAARVLVDEDPGRVHDGHGHRQGVERQPRLAVPHWRSPVVDRHPAAPADTLALARTTRGSCPQGCDPLHRPGRTRRHRARCVQVCPRDTPSRTSGALTLTVRDDSLRPRDGAGETGGTCGARCAGRSRRSRRQGRCSSPSWSAARRGRRPAAPAAGYDVTSALEAARVDRVPTPRLGWYRCGEGLQCATVDCRSTTTSRTARRPSRPCCGSRPASQPRGSAACSSTRAGRAAPPPSSPPRRVVPRRPRARPVRRGRFGPAGIGSSERVRCFPTTRDQVAPRPAERTRSRTGARQEAAYSRRARDSAAPAPAPAPAGRGHVDRRDRPGHGRGPPRGGRPGADLPGLRYGT